MRKARAWWLPVTALSCCLVAHAGDPTRSPRREAPPTRIPDVPAEHVQPNGVPVNTASMPLAVRRAVVADAARRFQVPENAVVLSGAEQVTWSDGALGCPQPGYNYTQALVPGFRVAATTSAGRFVYHTDNGGHVVTCGLPVRPSQKPGSSGASGAAAQPRTQPPDKPAPQR
jgi:hypothetical protein